MDDKLQEALDNVMKALQNLTGGSDLPLDFDEICDSIVESEPYATEYKTMKEALVTGKVQLEEGAGVEDMGVTMDEDIVEQIILQRKDFQKKYLKEKCKHIIQGQIDKVKSVYNTLKGLVKSLGQSAANLSAEAAIPASITPIPALSCTVAGPTGTLSGATLPATASDTVNPVYEKQKKSNSKELLLQIVEQLKSLCADLVNALMSIMCDILVPILNTVADIINLVAGLKTIIESALI